jgi:glutamate--cysteine ligase
MCLFRDSPPITSREQGENDENKNRVVNRGRQPDLQLLVHNREQPFRPLAHELFDDMQPFAEMLDAAYGGSRYSTTLQRLRKRIDDPDSTPSAQVLRATREQGGFSNFAMQMARQHLDGLRAQPLDAATAQKFTDSVATSLREQQQLDAAAQGSFDDFVASYYA